MPNAQFLSLLCSKVMGLFSSFGQWDLWNNFLRISGKVFLIKRDTHKGKFLSCFLMWLCEDMMAGVIAAFRKHEGSHLRTQASVLMVKRCRNTRASDGITELLN